MIKKLYGRAILGNVLWLLSLFALVSAWIASFRSTGIFLGLPVAHLYWDALVLGVLAIGAKAHRRGHIHKEEIPEMGK